MMKKLVYSSIVSMFFLTNAMANVDSVLGTFEGKLLDSDSKCIVQNTLNADGDVTFSISSDEGSISLSNPAEYTADALAHAYQGYSQVNSESLVGSLYKTKHTGIRFYKGKLASIRLQKTECNGSDCFYNMTQKGIQNFQCEIGR